MLRNACTADALITDYVKKGQFQHAILLYQKLSKEESFYLSKFTTVPLLKACTELNDLETGCQIHADTSAKGLVKTNIFIGSSLVDMYAKCGLFAEAQNVFDSLPDQNVITWTTLIAGYSQQEHGDGALKCFKLMHNTGILPNALTFACMMKACGNSRDVQLGQQIHASLESQGLLDTNQIVGNALITMYGKCGMLGKAEEIFDRLPDHDVVSWNALIMGHSDHGQGEEALTCFHNMTAEGITANTITFLCILKACTCIGAVDKAIEIHSEILRKGLLRKDHNLGSSLVDMYAKCGLLAKAQETFDKLPALDKVAWTALIAGYMQHDDCEKALTLFKQMLSNNISPDAVTYACCLKACGIIGTLDEGKEIHNVISRKDLLKRNGNLSNSLIDMYAKCGMMETAELVFDDIQMHDIVSWTALTTGYGQKGELEKTLLVFDRMLAEGLQPNPVTFCSVLKACSNVGIVEIAQTCFEVMFKYYGIIPTLEHYVCIVDLLGRAGQLEMSIILVKYLPLLPNVFMWLTVLGACRKWGNVQMAEYVFGSILQMDRNEESAYVCMGNIYVEAGMQDEALKIGLNRCLVNCG